MGQFQGALPKVIGHKRHKKHKTGTYRSRGASYPDFCEFCVFLWLKNSQL